MLVFCSLAIVGESVDNSVQTHWISECVDSCVSLYHSSIIPLKSRLYSILFLPPEPIRLLLDCLFSWSLTISCMYFTLWVFLFILMTFEDLFGHSWVSLRLLSILLPSFLISVKLGILFGSRIGMMMFLRLVFFSLQI
jgi:hypothetical protein